jgi:hypothetical protein
MAAPMLPSRRQPSADGSNDSACRGLTGSIERVTVPSPRCWAPEVA